MNKTPADTVLIVYESMFGGTRRIAEAIADGIRATHDVTVTPVTEAGPVPDDVALLIVGGPTHAHSLSRAATRAEAVQWVLRDQLELELETRLGDPGIRDWLKKHEPRVARHVAFDTRADMPRIFTGSAAAVIDKRLTRLGSERFAEPMSFLVDRKSHLLSGEVERAWGWGIQLAALLEPAAAR
ncbi:hypothetical protein [Microbacterium sp.]|jgi:hypothetical protein|uniref:hypothetical protein n=1 Tax=Microbacterium sp. TaxID=51671 RepID=UPI002CC3B1A4|nr:hypothetical protein [Microbacterium sp.]HWL76765.1 hypothetical protein [Microbacterium sp.]